MAFRNIIVESPARISVKNRQLVIRTDSDHAAALEDISALLLENRQTIITAAALSALGECGCCVFTCDEKQYESIEILLGELTPADEPFESEVLTVF